MPSEVTELFGEWESESEATEAAEAARRPVRRPSSQPSFKPRPAPNAPQYVTQVQLESALGRVDGKVKTVADGVSTINTRLATLSASLKKEADERKKSTDGQGKDLNQKMQMLALLPLLIQPSAKTLSTALPATDGSNVASVVVPDPNSQLDSLLPLLLISGMGGSSGGLSLGGDSSGSDSSLMMLALVLAFANKPSS